MQTPTHRKNALIIGALLGVVFALSLLLLILLPGLQKTGSLTALIYQDGRLLHTINLGAVTESYELTITDQSGHYNLIQVRPGSIGITDADCPDKLCVHMGFRDSTLLPITCLPNQLVIRLVKDSGTLQEDQPDGVTY